MFELQCEQATSSINHTSKRVFAPQPIYSSSKENDIKAHILFLQLARKKRLLSRLSNLNEENILIKANFSSIFENIKDVKSQLLKLINLQDGIIQNVNSKGDSLNLLIFTRNSQSRDIESQNILSENDIKQNQDINDQIKSSISVEKNINNILKKENEKFKFNLAKIKVEHTKVSSLCNSIIQKLDTKRNKYDVLSTKKDKLEITHHEIENSLFTYNEDTSKELQLISQLESEYFIKKRVSLKLLRDNYTYLHDSSSSLSKNKNVLDQKISELKSKISTIQKNNNQIEKLIAKVHTEFMQSLTTNVELENQKEELISMNQCLSENENNLEKDEIKKDNEIKKLNELIDDVKKDNDSIDNSIDEVGKVKFNQQISSNEQNVQWEQYISFICDEINKLKNDIDLIKTKKNK